jgi:hypothetical protein
VAGDARPSIKIVKTSPWRGDAAHPWSNRYHFNGGTPADSTHWEALRAAIVLVEKFLYKSETHIVEAIGYAAGSDVPVFEWSGSVAGANGLSEDLTTGEACGLLRYATTARTSKNHPVYLYNYFHAQRRNDADFQKISDECITRLSTFATDWISGFSDGTNTYTRCGPNGATATGFVVDPYFRIHTFPHSKIRA